MRDHGCELLYRPGRENRNKIPSGHPFLRSRADLSRNIDQNLIPDFGQVGDVHGHLVQFVIGGTVDAFVSLYPCDDFGDELSTPE
jgi:hypothetical protein